VKGIGLSPLSEIKLVVAIVNPGASTWATKFVWARATAKRLPANASVKAARFRDNKSATNNIAFTVAKILLLTSVWRHPNNAK
jgi:hypothetical protein